MSTFFFYITEDEREARRMIEGTVAPRLQRSPDVLSGRLGVGPPERLAATLVEFERLGIDKLSVWPVADPHTQLAQFMDIADTSIDI